MRTKSVMKQRIYAVIIALCVVVNFLVACAYDKGLIRFGTALCVIIGSAVGVLFFFHLIRLEETRAARSPRRW